MLTLTLSLPPVKMDPFLRVSPFFYIRQNPLGTGGVLAKRYSDLVHDLWDGHSKSITPLKFRVSRWEGSCVGVGCSTCLSGCGQRRVFNRILFVDSLRTVHNRQARLAVQQLPTARCPRASLVRFGWHSRRSQQVSS